MGCPGGQWLKNHLPISAGNKCSITGPLESLPHATEQLKPVPSLPEPMLWGPASTELYISRAHALQQRKPLQPEAQPHAIGRHNTAINNQ